MEIPLTFKIGKQEYNRNRSDEPNTLTKVGICTAEVINLCLQNHGSRTFPTFAMELTSEFIRTWTSCQSAIHYLLFILPDGR